MPRPTRPRPTTRRLAEARGRGGPPRCPLGGRGDPRRGAGEAEKSRRQVELEVSTALLDARRQAERDAADITENARALKQDLERRESRLAEREERLDAESRRVEQRDRELAEPWSASWPSGRAELDARAAEHEQELERVAGLTADDARAELLAAVEERPAGRPRS